MTAYVIVIVIGTRSDVNNHMSHIRHWSALYTFTPFNDDGSVFQMSRDVQPHDSEALFWYLMLRNICA